MRPLSVDFNDDQGDGVVYSLREFADARFEPFVGGTVTISDGEITAQGTIRRIDPNGLIVIQIVEGTYLDETGAPIP